MASDHPLAAHSALRLHQIVAYPVALPESGLGSRMLLESFFSRSSLSYRVVLESNSFALLMRFVQQEPAATFQIALGTSPAASTSGIVSRPIQEPGLAAADVVLGQLRARILTIAASKFAEQMALRLDALND